MCFLSTTFPNAPAPPPPPPILFDQSLTNYLFTCIQSSSILESQFKINRHFAFSRVDVRESGNNGDIWQCYLIKSVFLNPVLLNSFW